MKQSDLKFTLLAIVFALAAACSSDSKTSTHKSSARDTVYTTIKVSINLTANDYKDVAAMKILFDTTKSVVVDSSDNKQTSELTTIRDSMYMAWWDIPVPDSTGKKALRKKDNSADSTTLGWVPVRDKAAVVWDYMKNWPIK